MKPLSIGLALAAVLAFPAPARTQSDDVKPVPEGRIIFSSCLPDQGRDYEMCTETQVSLLPGETHTPPELFSLAADGREQMTDNNLYEFRKAVWSPAGGRVAISAGAYADYEDCRAYVLSGDGSSASITPQQDLACPTVADWSPDGDWILMTVYFHDGPTQLYKVRPDGTQLRALTDFHSEGQEVTGAAFIRRGRSIAYWGEVPRGRGVHIMSAKGEYRRTVFKLKRTGPDRMFLGSVSVSPNNQRVAYSIHDGSDKSQRRDEIFTVNIDGTDRRRLTFNDLDETAISWGPDSKRLAIVLGSMYSSEPTTHIKVIDVGTRDIKKLQRPSSGEIYMWAQPIWSPSGEYLAFESSNTESQSAVYVGNIRTGKVRRVTDFDTPLQLFSWRP